MSRAVLPEVYHIITGYNDVRLVHLSVLGLNSKSLGLNRTSNCIAEYEQPLIDGLVASVFGNQNAVFSTGNNFLEAVHILHMALIDGGVPEDDAHVVALRFAESKYKGL
jgi:hypothetical protein